MSRFIDRSSWTWSRGVVTAMAAASGLWAVLALFPQWKAVLTAPDIAPVAMMAALGLILGYLATLDGRLSKSERLQEKTTTELTSLFAGHTTEIVKSVQGGGIVPFEAADDAFRYVAKRLEETKKVVRHASLAPPVDRSDEVAQIWEQAIDKVLAAGAVDYRYIVRLEAHRADRVKRVINSVRLKVKRLEGASSMPSLSFIIFDDCEMVIHHPYGPGGDEIGTTYLKVKNAALIRMFIEYWKVLWQEASPLSKAAA